MRPTRDDHRFHVGHAVLGWLAAFVLGVLGAALVVAAFGYAGTPRAQVPLWVTFVAQVPLWSAQFAVVVAISRVWGTGRWRDDYGVHVRPVDGIGVVVGGILQLVFVPLLYKGLEVSGLDGVLRIDVGEVESSARELTDQAHGLGIVLLVVLVVVGAPVVEELFFRGLVLRSLRNRYRDPIALVGSTVMFAAIHFNWTTFPALVMFGLVVGYAAQYTGRLGMPIAIHAGFNGTTLLAHALT